MMRKGWATCAAAALGLLLGSGPAVAAPAASATASASAGASATGLRDVVIVGNNSEGTVSFLDAHTFQNLGKINVIPDLQQVMGGWDVFRKLGYDIVKQQAGGEDKFADDAYLSPDGRSLYVSRGNLGDVAAFDVATGTELWRTDVSGLKADHAALSPDGKRFIVSAISDGKAQAFDTATGAVTGEFATGSYPHENIYSADGKHIYNMSIGVVSFPKALNLLKGPKQVTVADADTLKVVRTYTFDYGIRPAIITPDEKTMYAELSYLNGFIEYDLTTGKTVRTVEMPYSDKAKALDPDNYPLNSAFHGMSINGTKDKLCAVGTIDDYVAIVSRPGLTTDGFVNYPTDALPYWATTTPDGNYCFVTLSNRDEVSVIDYRTHTEVARVPVGHYPQRERPGKIDESVLGGLS
jgi:YVTN family beta-propeller protein